jgi:hypothetical protein
MTTPALPAISDRQAADRSWAVETHGLTKKFGPNTTGNGVELSRRQEIQASFESWFLSVSSTLGATE